MSRCFVLPLPVNDITASVDEIVLFCALRFYLITVCGCSVCEQTLEMADDDEYNAWDGDEYPDVSWTFSVGLKSKFTTLSLVLCVFVPRQSPYSVRSSGRFHG